MDKKIRKVAIFSILFAIILFSTKTYATTGKILNDSTRIRKNASTSSTIIEELSKNDKIEIVSEDGDWYKVKHNTKNGSIEGYIRKDLVEVEEKKTEESKETTKKDENTNNESSEKTEKKAEEKSQENNTEETKTELKEKAVIELDSDTEVRVIPLIFASKNVKIAKATKVTVIEILGNWCHIESEDKDGWILKSKIEKNVKTESKDTKTEEKQEEKQDENKNEKVEENKQEEKKQEEKKAETTMYVSTTTLNVREKAEKNAKITAQLDQNTKVTVVEKVDDTWSKINANGKKGYVASKYLSSKKTAVSSRSSQEPRTTESTSTENIAEKSETKTENKTETKTEVKAENKTETKAETKAETKTKDTVTSNKESNLASEKKDEAKSSESKVTGSEIVAYAKKFLGYKYVYGTAGPNTFDCSGFTSYVYKHFGYSLNRTSGGQRSNGKAVSKDNLQAGDIVCFSGHVGIYIGGNQFIHAANPKKGVIITSLSDSYYVKTYITARRILD